MIIMNPPYDKNLHLKIIEQSIPMLTDDGILVNLSPIRWLQDPTGKYRNSQYKTFENTVSVFIDSIKVIPAVDAANMFSATMDIDLGVYVLTKKSSEYYKDFNTNHIVDKVIESKVSSLSSVVEHNNSDGWRCRVSYTRPTPSHRPNSNVYKSFRFETTHYLLSWVYKDGFTKDGVHWSQNVVQKAKRGGDKYGEGSPLPESIPFPNEAEAVNFENSTKTTFYRYLVLTVKTDSTFPMNFLPWMGDCINPRTGLKGYEGEWTDDDFRSYFGITDSEWEEIIETMKPYL